MITASWTHLPSSEKTVTAAADSCIAPSSASCALQADGDGADRLHVAVAGLPAEPPDLLDDAGGVGDREGVGHGEHGGVAAERRGAGAGEHGLGVLAAGLAQVGVQVDQARQQHLPPASTTSAPSAVSPVADLGDRLAVDQDVLRLAAEHLRTADQVLLIVSVTSPRSVTGVGCWTAGSLPPSSR